MKIMAIPGSIREHSYNLALLRAMESLAPSGVAVSIYEGLKDIPVFNPDVAEQGAPAIVEDFLVQLRDVDAVVISTPEYAHGIPGVLKNALDWAVSSDALVLKPVVVTSVSTSGLGGVRAHGPLVLVLSAMNANVIVQGSFNVPYAQQQFSSDLTLTDPITKKSIDVAFMALQQAVENQ